MYSPNDSPICKVGQYHLIVKQANAKQPENAPDILPTDPAMYLGPGSDTVE